jgi:hypothetical protein
VLELFRKELEACRRVLGEAHPNSQQSLLIFASLQGEL